jgi:hypothetical protein
LIGLEWSIARLAANMNVFGFGPIREIETRRGKGTIGTLALHVQCPWRVIGTSGIATGKSDRYTWDGPDIEPEDWSYEDGQSLQTAKLDALLGPRQRDDRAYFYNSGLIIEASAVDPSTGDLIVQFGRGLALQVFPDGTAHEQWRLLDPGTESPHLVFPKEDEQEV